MNASFLKSILNRGARIFGLHPDVGNLLSGSFRLTNPSSAAFPTENLPLASRVIASGMWNYCFFQFYRHFAGPYWVEKQYNPEDPSFIPRAGSMLSVNLTNRDWMGFRSPNGNSHAMVDPAGALSPVIGYYSIEIAIRENGRLRLPAKGELEVNQTLLDDLPIPVTHYAGKQTFLKWTAAGSMKQETVINEIEYETGGEYAEIIISIRPFNPEGAALLHSLKLDENNIVHVNDTPEIILFSEPDDVIFSNLELGDAYFIENHVKEIQCPDGVATGAVTYRVKGNGKIYFAARTYEQNYSIRQEESILKSLFSSQKKKISSKDIYKRMDLYLTAGRSLRKLRKHRKAFLKYFKKSSYRSRKPEAHAPAKSAAAKGEANSISMANDILETRDAWDSIISQGASFQCGRNEWNRAAKIFKGYIMTLYADESITPGVFTYRQFWFRDAAYMLSALAGWNYLKEAKTVLVKYPSLQSPDGFFKSHEGEWDSNGQALWTLSYYIKLSGDLDLLKDVYPAMKKGADWIVRKRKSGLDKKLMPAGFSAEHLGPGDYYYWDNFWSISGLFETSYAAGLLGNADDEAHYSLEAQKYADDTIATSEETRSKYGMITAGPRRPADAGMIGSICLLYPLKLFSIFPENQIKNTVNAIYKNYFNRGLFFHPIIHSGYNIYLSIQTAQAFLRMDDASTARKILKKALQKKKDLWTYPEAIHPGTGGGVMGDGFHGWAFAEILQLLREFVVFETGDTIQIFKGLRKKELLCENLKFGPFPVHGGSIAISGNMTEESGNLKIIFKKSEISPCRNLAIRLPPGNVEISEFPEKSVKKENSWIILENPPEEINFRYSAQKAGKAC